MLKRFLPRGLLARILLILILPVFIVQGFGIYIFYERHWDKLAQRLSMSVAGDIGLVSEWYEQDDDFLNPAQRIRLKRYINLDAKPGEEGEKNLSKVKYKYLSDALIETLDERPFALYNPAGDNFTAIVQTSRGPVTIEVPKKRLYSSTTRIFVLWLVGLTFLLLTIAAVFLKRQLKPILRLASAAWQNGRSQSHVPLKLEGAEEVRRATAAFMDMQEQIKRDKDQRDAILLGVREDLQKPIDRLKLMLDTVLPTHPDTPSMIADLRSMEKMIDGYLSYVRDNKDEPLKPIKVHEIITEAKRLAGANRLKMEFNEADSPIVMARPLALTRAFANIIRNSATYGADLLIVDVRTLDTDDGRMVLMCLEDNGPGMDENAMRKALHPLDNLNEGSSGKKPQGYGIAIAADILAGHGGRLELSKGLKGLRVTMVMPG